MPFSDTEKLSNVNKMSLQITGAKNAPPGQGFWYNEDLDWVPIVPPTKIWADFASIPGAADAATADAAVTANPTILEKRIIRLTVDPTSNSRAYEARITFGNRTTNYYNNWVQPSMIRLSGGMSPGYSIRLYNGDPAGAGVEIPTTQWGGAGGSPSWQFNYSAGLITVSTDQAANYLGVYNGAGLWVVGYRYIGEYGGGSGGGLVTTVTQANAFEQGQPVYLNSSTGLWELAQANDDSTMGVAIVDAPTSSSFNAIYGGAISGLSGIVPGEYYWVDSIASGVLTETKPPVWHNPLLHAETTTEGMVLPYRPSKDEASSSGGGPTILDDRTLISSGHILDTDSVVLLDGSSNVVSAQLPDASTVEGKVFYVVTINVTNLCDIIMTGMQTLSGQNGYTFALAWEKVQIYSDGSNYILL